MDKLDTLLQEISQYKADGADRADEEQDGLDTMLDELDKAREQVNSVLSKAIHVQEADQAALPIIEAALAEHDAAITSVTGLERDPATTVQVKDGYTLLMDTLFNTMTSMNVHTTHEQASQWAQAHPQLFKDPTLADAIGNVARTMVLSVQTLRALPALVQRVLGLYDVFVFKSDASPVKETTLSVVEPNVRRYAERSHILYEDMLVSVALHEEIHARQFYAVPSLGEKKAALSKEHSILGCMAEDWPELRDVPRDQVRKRLLVAEDCMTSLMSVVEGHADYYTERVLEQVFGQRGYQYYNALMDIRKESLSAKMRKLWWDLTQHPLAKKGEQYTDGAAFFERVREVMGDGASRHCLENPPRNMRELLNPDIYLVRQRLL